MFWTIDSQSLFCGGDIDLRCRRWWWSPVGVVAVPPVPNCVEAVELHLTLRVALR